MKKIDEERIKSEKEGGKTAKLYQKQLEIQKRELKRSKGLDIIGEFGRISEQSGIKDMKEVFGKFETKKFSEDIAAMAGVSKENVEQHGQKEILDRVIRQTAIDMNKQMQEVGIKEGYITEKDIEEALKEGQGTEKFQQLQAKLEEANQNLITRMQEDADPQTKALHHIEDILESIKTDLLGGLQDAKAGDLGKFFDAFSTTMLDVAIQGKAKGGAAFTPGESGLLDQAAIIDAFTGNDISKKMEENLAGNKQYQEDMKKATETLNEIARSAGLGNAASLIEEIRAGYGQALDWISNIIGTVIPATEKDKTPTKDIGTNKVIKSGLAFVHEGEQIIPKKYANPLEDTGPYKINKKSVFDKEMFDTVMGKNLSDIQTMEFRRGRDDVGGGPQTLEYRPNAERSFYTGSRQYGVVPQIVNNGLMPNNDRVRTQMANVQSKISNFEEKNSSEIVYLLKGIRSDLKNSIIDRSGGRGGGANDQIDMLAFDNRMEKDSRSGAIRNGDHSYNDSIKAIRF